jgi:hypothetical protein
VICQIQLYRWSKRGILQRPSFQLFGTPYTSYATLLFLVAVTALMCYENYWNLVALVVITPALVGAAGTPYAGGCWRWPPNASASPATNRHRRDARDGRIPRQGRQGVSARSR